jgi:gamma-tubulin complex component 2
LEFHEIESIVVDEFLYVLLGFSSDHISIIKSPFTLNFSPQIPTTIANSLSRLAPLVQAHLNIKSYIDDKRAFDAGKLHHAIAAALRDLVKEYYVQIASFDGSIQSLVYKMNATMDTLVEISNCVSNIRDCKGGLLLDIIHESYIKAGNDSLKLIYQEMFNSALVPYIDILRNWIYKGQIQDPFSEFFVKERRVGDNSMLSKGSWEYRYFLSEDAHVPFFIRDPDLVLKCGKYFNVARECKHSFEENKIPRGLPSMQVLKSIEKEIESQFTNSNKTVMNVFKTYQINEHFEAVRKCFFLLNLRTFFESCSELKQYSRDVDKERVKRLFESLVGKDLDVPGEVRVHFVENCIFETLSKICAVTSDLDFPDWTSSKMEFESPGT